MRLVSPIALALLLSALAPGVACAHADEWTAPAEAALAVKLEPAFPALSFERPVFLTGAGDGSERLFVVEQHGVIHVFPDDPGVTATTVFLDLSAQVSRRGNEEGLLGLAFAPDYAQSGVFYVHYSSSVRDETGFVSRFRVSADDPDRADPESEEILLAQAQPWRNHNGGMIAFGPDGMLYIAFGDGGAANDPRSAGQDLSTWLATILRVDVSDHEGGYTVPADNPFVDVEGAKPEIWAYGLRNVWRFSFDRQTGALWAGDVGQNRLEEIDLIERGGNYGWNSFEASEAFKGGAPLRPGSTHVAPVAEYTRADGLSVTGGYVYRGPAFPELQGTYVFADYVFGTLWAVTAEGDGWVTRRLGRTDKSIASFGEDDAGELYVLSFDDGIDRLLLE